MIKVLASIALAALIAGGPAGAQESRLRSARVSAPDVAKTAAFYQSVFGLKEVRHIDRDGALFEVILNYGATVEAASASKLPKVVVILRAQGAPAPSVSNLVFGVSDLDAVMAKSVKAGGVISRPATKSATSGATIGFVKDPAGNEIELIEER
jgi:predicted enzyme related to lactoylglutathione lyase